MSDEGTAKAIEQLKVEADNYDQTVLALKTVAHELQWDDERKELSSARPVSFGRRFDTSPTNKVTPNNVVTPDLVVCSSDSHGVLVEAKMTLPKDPKLVEQAIKKWRKYDDDLIGWCTPDERVERHDIIVLTGHFIGNSVADTVRKLAAESAVSFERNLALVKFTKVQQANESASLELNYGSLADTRKYEKLRKTLAIPLTHVVANVTFSHVKLYDADPPHPYLMELIRQKIHSSLTREQNLDIKEGKPVEILIDVSELREALSEAFGPGPSGHRVPEIPKKAWVKKAMERFVRLKWATRVKSNPDLYTYIAKKRITRSDAFFRVCAKVPGKQISDRPVQLDLPGFHGSREA